ncbi:ATP-binding protein [Kitasatospora viridis]|uniref:NB-ARC domain-containing protein n=1 Tax=Kitasatospora viridis TaxID=281105 RepID=A0A561UPJ3_9ACTN|nr:tetratricopeptide repeat protein [Kitasatospora viridis]TWG01296.1 NB-ARC domain-containing protein [Kitasatospora viridis]
MAGRSGEAYPDPESAADLPEFIDLLGQLRICSGQPSYRTLAARIGPRLRPPQTLSHTTVSDLFQRRRRRLDLDLVLALVRALGVDEPAVARWRTACVRVHSEAKRGGPSGVLRQLPGDLATFTGRRRELAQLLAAVTEPGADRAATAVVRVIEGMGGIGKTRLAVHTAHRLVAAGRCTDAQLYADLRGFDPEQPPADPATVLDAFLRQLGIPGAQIPPGRDARAAMFRDRLHDRDALVLLDNAANEQQVRDLLPAGPDCVVLITSRRSLAGLDGATVQLLGGFSPAEAVALLARIAGADRVAAEPAAAEVIVRACGLLPLAVALVSARLRSRPSWTLAELAAQLDTDPLDLVRAGDRSLRLALDLSYQGLAPPARHLFRSLGLHPGEDFAPCTAAALAGIDEAAARGLLERLQDEHLLLERPGRRYGLHDLVRRYAGELCAEPGFAPAREAAVGRLADWLQLTAAAINTAVSPGNAAVPPPAGGRAARLPHTDPADSPSDRAIAFVGAELDGLAPMLRLITRHGHRTAAWQTSYLLAGALDRIRPVQALAITEAGLDAALLLGDPAAERLMHATYAAHCLNVRRPAEALGHAQRAVELVDRTGPFRSKASSHNILGRTLSQLRRYDEAAAAYAQAVAYYRQAEEPRGLAMALGNLAAPLLCLGRGAEAREVLGEAVELSRAGGDQRGAAYALAGLGGLHLRCGDPAAEAVLGEALAAARAITDRAQEALTLNLWADAATAAGDHATAHQRLGAALAIAQRYHHTEAEASTRLRLGRLALHSEDLPTADTELARAVELWSPSYHAHEEARLQHILGLLARCHGDPAAAERHRRAAAALYRLVHAPEDR